MGEFARPVPPNDETVARRQEAAARLRLGLSVHVAACFKKPDERAVLSVIAREVATKGACELSRVELAKQAGVRPAIAGRTIRLLIAEGKIAIRAWASGGALARVSRVEITDWEWLRCARVAFAPAQ